MNTMLRGVKGKDISDSIKTLQIDPNKTFSVIVEEETEKPREQKLKELFETMDRLSDQAKAAGITPKDFLNDK